MKNPASVRESPIRVMDLLALSAQYLSGRGADSGRLDAELLLADVLNVDRLGLYLMHDRPVAGPERDAFREMVRRRAAGEPVAYILGRKEFYGLSFEVDCSVLIPRPETEILVDRALEALKRMGKPRIADVGVGSGAISVALAINCAEASIVATDVSEEALKLARRNAEAHKVADRIELRLAYVLSGVDGPFDVVVSNPPYVAETEVEYLPPDVRDFEPRQALVAGPEGTEVMRELIAQSKERLLSGGVLLFEIGLGQKEKAEKLLSGSAAFGPAQIFNDLAGHPRIVAARREK